MILQVSAIALDTCDSGGTFVYLQAPLTSDSGREVEICALTAPPDSGGWTLLVGWTLLDKEAL